MSEQTKAEALANAKAFLQGRLAEVEAAVSALDAGDFRTAGENINSAASNLPLMAPLLNLAQGLPDYPQPSIFSPED